MSFSVPPVPVLPLPSSGDSQPLAPEPPPVPPAVKVLWLFPPLWPLAFAITAAAAWVSAGNAMAARWRP